MAKPFRGVLYAVLLLIPVIASAQNNRSAVSVNGLDTNPCTPISPCRSFGAAMLQTNASGEIIALDSGGYGGFTVDRAVTVLGAPGVYAGITTTSGDAITISAGASSTVVLRNLTINGAGSGHAGVGVTGSAAETHVESCIIQNFTTYGVVAFFNVRISDTTFRRCGTAIWIDNAGAPVVATVLNSVIKDMSGGDANSPGTGILAFRNASVTVRNSVVLKAANYAFRASNGTLNLDNCMAADSGTGVIADSSGTARMSNNFITENTTGVSNGATIESFQNNKIAGNTTDLSGGALTNLGLN